MKWSVAIVLAAGCGNVKDVPDASVPGDGRDGDAPGLDAHVQRCDPSKPFGPPVALTSVNSSGQEIGATLTPDEHTIVFSALSELKIATRTSNQEPFDAPALLDGVNSSANEGRPSITGDGLTLYIELTTPVASTGNQVDIVVATRPNTTTSFGAHTPVTALNTSTQETSPFVLPDHSAIYFVSDRTAKGQLFRAARVGGTFGPPAAVGGTELQDGNPKLGVALTPDERVLYISSERPGGLGLSDVYRATRASAAVAFGAPVHERALSSQFFDNVSWVSADDCVVYLSRSAGGTTPIFDIFVATRPL